MKDPQPIDWDEDVEATGAESYESLLRSLQHAEGFSLFFICAESADRFQIVQQVKANLPLLQVQHLEVEETLGDLYPKVIELPDRDRINVLFISGLEKLLAPYRDSGYSVPRVLGHLNLQRERFRDDFPFCLVFLLPEPDIKLMARKAPDFFDWRSGVFEIKVSLT